MTTKNVAAKSKSSTPKTAAPNPLEKYLKAPVGPIETYNFCGSNDVDWRDAAPTVIVEEISALLHKLRHSVDYGTGSAIGGEGECEHALRHRLDAHDALTRIESLIEELERAIGRTAAEVST